MQLINIKLIGVYCCSPSIVCCVITQLIYCVKKYLYLSQVNYRTFSHKTYLCLKAILLVFQYILASKCSNVVINVIVWFAVYTLKKLESDNDTEQTKITLSILISIMHVVRILQNNSMEIQRLESSSPFGTLKENIQKHLVRDYFINAIKGLTS